MKVTVTCVCEFDDIEIDEKYRALCHVFPDEEEEAMEVLCCEMRDDVENQLLNLGFVVDFIDSIESDDGCLLYEN